MNFAPGAGNTFTYANNFTGINQVNVNSGTLVLTGNNAATAMTVSNGGTLAGTGTIASALSIANGSMLLPGTPGTAGTTLHVTGTVTFASGAVYLDTINGGTASKTAITGTATLGGATVQLASGSAVTIGTKYTILTDTGGGLGGANTFAGGITFNGLNGALSYDADDVFSHLHAAAAPAPRLAAAAGRVRQRRHRRAGDRHLRQRRRHAAVRLAEPVRPIRLTTCEHARAARRRGRGRRADWRVQPDDELSRAAARRLDRGPRRYGRRGDELRGAGRAEPAARRPAGLCISDQAAAHGLRPALGHLGRRVRRHQPHRRQCDARHQHRDGARLRLRGRRRLPRLTRHYVRLLARRRRHQLGPRTVARDRPQRRLHGRRLRHDARGAGLSRRRARVRGSLVHHQPHAAGRPAHRALQRPERRRAARERLPHRVPGRTARSSASRPMRPRRRNGFARRATARPTSPAAASVSPTRRRPRTTCAARSACASTTSRRSAICR